MTASPDTAVVAKPTPDYEWPPEGTVCTHYVLVHQTCSKPITGSTHGIVCVDQMTRYWFRSGAEAQAFAERHQEWRHIEIHVRESKNPYIFRYDDLT